MRYQGSKKRIAAHVVKLIQDNIGDRTYVEPFIGGCNVFKDVMAKHKIGADANAYVIGIWQGLKNGSLNIPDDISKPFYYDVKQSYKDGDGRYSKGMIGIVGILGSYGGKFFNGYANFNPKKNENHVQEALSGLRRDWNGLRCKSESEFVFSDYRELAIPEHSLIYCDPPYQNTSKYNGTDDFDSEAFWDWCRMQEANDNIVIVSEYSAPEDFVCVWQKEIKCGMDSRQGEKQSLRVEKMFVHKNRLKNFVVSKNVLSLYCKQ